MKVLINAQIYDYDQYIENGYVRFDKEFEKPGRMENFARNSSDEVIDCHGDLIMPSFVCAHTHIYSIFARGLSLPFNPKNFQDILDQMWWKIDAKITNQVTYFSGICAAAEFLLNGVTTIIDHHASGEIRDSLSYLSKAVTDVAGIRGIYCFETSDRYSVGECINENIEFSMYHNSEKCAGLFGMHASMSLSDRSLTKIANAIDNRPIHIHVAESKMDEDDCENKYNCKIIHRLNKYKLLKKDSLIVHGVYLDESELNLLSKKRVSIVVNTTSNMNNAVGIPNVKSFIDHGIPVMVGNDGLNTNMASEYMNVLYTSHLKNDSPKELNITDVKQMILNSYDYVSRILKIKLGQIKSGFAADFMRIKYKPFTEIDDSNAFGHIFYGLFPSLKPSDVFINGEQLVKNYELVNDILREHRLLGKQYADELWSKVKENKK